MLHSVRNSGPSVNKIKDSQNMLLASSNSGMVESTESGVAFQTGLARGRSRLSLSLNSRGSNYLKRPSPVGEANPTNNEMLLKSRDKEREALAATNALLVSGKSDVLKVKKLTSSSSQDKMKLQTNPEAFQSHANCSLPHPLVDRRTSQPH